MQDIINAFCQYRGVEVADIFNYDRFQKNYFTRYMIWHYLHCAKGISVGCLSKTFKRNRPSIFRGIRLLKHQFKYDKRLCAEYNGIVEKIEGATEVAPSGVMEEMN